MADAVVVPSLTFRPRLRRMHHAAALIDKSWLRGKNSLPDIREDRGCSKRNRASWRDRVGSQSQAAGLPCGTPRRDEAVAGAGAGCGLDKALREPTGLVFPFASSGMDGGGEHLRRHCTRRVIVMLEPETLNPKQS